ncbi:MAG: hypothetical protein ACRD4F_09320 [Candidatus Angelobacter sp.]
MLQFAMCSLLGLLPGLSMKALAPIKDGKQPSACNPSLIAGPNGKTLCTDTQQTDTQQKDTHTGDGSSQPGDEESATLQRVSYFPGLAGPDSIIVPERFRLGYLFGITASEGYDTAAAGLSTNVPSEIGIYEANLGGLRQGGKSTFLFQHSATLTHYANPQFPLQFLQRSLFVATGAFNRQWEWSLEGRNTYGNDSLRLVAQLPSTLVGAVPVVKPDSALLGINNGRILAPEASGGLAWKPGPTDTFRLSLHNSYQEQLLDHTHVNISGVKLDYQKSLSDRTSLGVYGLGTYETGQLRCTSTGGGAEITLRPTNDSLIELAAGPQFGSQGCGAPQQFNFHLTLAGVVSARTRAYLSANREYSSGYVSQGTWEDNIVGGMETRLTRKLSWLVDSGYVRGTGFGTAARYSGYFASTQLRHRISRDFTLAAEYRYFSNAVSGVGAPRNIGLVSLIWNPSGHNRESAIGLKNSVLAADSRGDHEN